MAVTTSIYLFNQSVSHFKAPYTNLYHTVLLPSTYISERVLEGCCFLSNMKKMVLKVTIEDEKSKRRVMQTVAGVEGVESVAVDMKEETITVIGEADPVDVAMKLRKFGYTQLLSVGPAKEEKKEEGKKKEEKKEEKKTEPPTIVYVTPSSYGPYPYRFEYI